MTKEQFVELYVINFCSAWAAANYNDYCIRGWQEQLGNPPIEDAITLAEEIWTKYQALRS